MFEFLFNIQRSIHQALTADIAAYAEHREWQTLLAMLPFGIVFGAAHAMTPGHSKSVLATYILGADLRPIRALLTSFALSFTHIGSAVLLSVIANNLITRTLVGAGQAPALELTSRLLLMAIGLWLIVLSIRGRPHMHGEGVGFGIVAGLVPCPLTLFVMVLALSRDVPMAGLAFSLSMLLGVGAILALVAMIAAVARSVLVRLIERHGMSLRRVSRVLDAVAGACLTMIAALELSR